MKFNKTVTTFFNILLTFKDKKIILNILINQEKVDNFYTDFQQNYSNIIYHNKIKLYITHT